MNLNQQLAKIPPLIASLSIIFFAATAHAEDFYVAQNATGSGNGTNATNAYGVSFFNTSANWASGNDKISAGDTVHLVGSIATTLTVQGSGISGSPIRIVFEPGAKLSKPFWGTLAEAAIYASSKSFITIDGANVGIIECTSNGDNSSNQQQSHGINISRCDNWEIKNLTIRNIYVHTYNTNNKVPAYSTLCIKASGSSNLSIHHNTLNNAYTAIYCLTENSGAISGINLNDNTISSCSTAIIAALGASNSSMSGVNIFSNDIEMGANWFDTPNNNHVDGIHCWTSNLGDMPNLQIYNNYIHGDCGGHCTGYVFLENLMTSPMIYNNLLVATGSKPAEAFIDVSTHGGTKHIYNNTIVGLGNTNTGGIGLVVYDGASTRASVKNNIFKSLYVAVSDNSNDTWDSDYNAYYDCGSIGYNGAFKSSLSTWQAAVGGETHSIIADPLLTATYAIGANSPAALGVNLSSLLTLDKAGSSRSATGNWGMGCYVIEGSSNPTLPPSNASVLITVK